MTSKFTARSHDYLQYVETGLRKRFPHVEITKPSATTIEVSGVTPDALKVFVSGLSHAERAGFHADYGEAVQGTAPRSADGIEGKILDENNRLRKEAEGLRQANTGLQAQVDRLKQDYTELEQKYKQLESDSDEIVKQEEAARKKAVDLEGKVRELEVKLTSKDVPEGYIQIPDSGYEAVMVYLASFSLKMGSKQDVKDSLKGHFAELAAEGFDFRGKTISQALGLAKLYLQSEGEKQLGEAFNKRHPDALQQYHDALIKHGKLKTHIDAIRGTISSQAIEVLETELQQAKKALDEYQQRKTEYANKCRLSFSRIEEILGAMNNIPVFIVTQEGISDLKIDVYLPPDEEGMTPILGLMSGNSIFAKTPAEVKETVTREEEKLVSAVHYQASVPKTFGTRRFEEVVESVYAAVTGLRGQALEQFGMGITILSQDNLPHKLNMVYERQKRTTETSTPKEPGKHPTEAIATGFARTEDKAEIFALIKQFAAEKTAKGERFTRNELSAWLSTQRTDFHPTLLTLYLGELVDGNVIEKEGTHRWTTYGLAAAPKQ